MRVEKRTISIPGCYELQPAVVRDTRGSFVKTVHKATFERLGVESTFVEQFYSVSVRGVLRGMHFQRPPHQHAKLVYCTAGEVLDVGVDLRRGSPTYGQHQKLLLSAEQGNMVYLPAGIAHGFCSLSDSATLIYNVTSMHVPDADSGIRWDSAGIAWPIDDLVISDRDSLLIPLADFESPFVFEQPAETRP